MSSSSTNRNSSQPLPGAFSDLKELFVFADIRLIAFDLDGTLISKSDELPGDRLAKLIGIVGRNTNIILATGRTFEGVKKIVEQLTGLSKLPLVLYNGSVLMDPKNELLITQRAISENATKKIIETVEKNGISAFFYCIDPEAHVVTLDSCSEKVYYLGCENIMPEREFNGMRLRHRNEMNVSKDKIVAILIECFEQNTKIEIQEKLKRIEDISITASSSRFIEVRPAESSKALGVEELCKRRGISRQQVLAMGDNDNDAELLEWAGISVCVRDASPLARQKSSYYSSQGAGSAAIEVLEIVRRSQRLFKKERKNVN